MEFKNILPEPFIERININELLKFNITIPECQREKEWDDSMYENAIDSIIKNIDIGQIIISHNENLDRSEIIDGQHRFEAIKKFISNDISIFNKNNKKAYFREIEDIFLNKKITICKYINLTSIQKTQLYMRINSGIEQNLEHMEKINNDENIIEYLKKYYNNFESNDVGNIVINSILYILNDYYINGEAHVSIKNLTKKNHFLKNLNNLDENFNSDDTQNILEIFDHIFNQIFTDKTNIYKYINKLNKIKISVLSPIIYHIFHEEYNLIKEKKYIFTEDLDIFYSKVLISLENNKISKIKDVFNNIILQFNKYKRD
jgi:hypothetical protein